MYDIPGLRKDWESLMCEELSWRFAPTIDDRPSPRVPQDWLSRHVDTCEDCQDDATVQQHRK